MLAIPLEIGLTLAALWFYFTRRRPFPIRLLVLTGVLLALQAVNWFGPVEPQVTVGTSLLAFFAFGIVALTAWWMGKSERQAV